MSFFDVNAMIGPCFAPRLGRYPLPEALIDDMDLYGIEEALVYHGLAYEYHAMTGNRELAALVAGRPRLRMAWCVGLHQDGQYPPPRDLVDELIDSGAVAARFFWGGLLAETSFPDAPAHASLWDQMQRRLVPAIISFDAEATVRGSHVAQLSGLLGDFPDLPVILSFARMARDRAILYDRLERHPNLHVETTGLMANGMIEDMVTRFGAGRLLFGTNFPWYKGGQTRVALAYTAINDADKALIAGGNLRRLTGGIRR